ncbi:MAG: efflux RND transporter periplasmic adaptor subunit [Verrucomicrobia subdivision 3 bacterium]|nr:efflux RND transporter periplasmic adaptor subunit [Limisphaerales bacterium]
MKVSEYFTNRRVRRSAQFLLLTLVAGLVAYRLKFSPTPVTTHSIATGEVRGEVMGTGTLEARVKTTISPRIQERLAEVFVDQGDIVKVGQLLARLDDAETKQQVAIAEATLAAARATVERVRSDEVRAQAVLKQAQLDHRRSTELLAGKIAAQADFDKTAEALHVAEADLKRSQAAIVEAQSQVFTAEKNLLYQKEHLAFTEMRSPYDGLVTRRDRDPGGIVVPGGSILQLVATNEIWVSNWVDETAMAGLKADQPARVVFRSEPDRSYAGEVARLGREADRETREFIVDVRVKELPENWTIGQRAEVFIETGHKSNSLLIPPQFVRWRENKPGVLVNDHGRARWRELTLGLRGSQNIEVTQGLSADEQIVRPIEGQKQPLSDGQRITAK